MHASIWKFSGDPAHLLPRYDAMLEEIPRGSLQLHLCLKGTDGILLVDTCPDRETFERFVAGPAFRALRTAHGLPEPEEVRDFPVHAAYMDGGRRE